MRLPEQNLWQSMKRNRPEDIELERVENLMGSGFPDVESYSRQRIAKIELKAPKRRARGTTAVLGNKEGLNRDQRNWFLTAARLDLPAFILIRVQDSHQLYLLPAAYGDAANELNHFEMAAVSLADDWESVFAIIRGEGPL